MKRNPLVWLSEALLMVTALPMLAMMLHISLDVFMKYVFGSPINGTLEITAYYYMIAIVLLPLAFTELTRQSIAVDLFFLNMPRKLQMVTAVFVLLLSAVVYGGFAWISLPDAISAFERREIVMGAVRVYIWPARFLLPLALALCAAVCVMQAIRIVINPSVREDYAPSKASDEDGAT